MKYEPNIDVTANEINDSWFEVKEDEIVIKTNTNSEPLKNLKRDEIFHFICDYVMISINVKDIFIEPKIKFADSYHPKVTVHLKGKPKIEFI